MSCSPCSTSTIPKICPSCIYSCPFRSQVIDVPAICREIGSCEIQLRPQRIRSVILEKDVGTAGSCMLLVQVRLPPGRQALQQHVHCCIAIARRQPAPPQDNPVSHTSAAAAASHHGHELIPLTPDNPSSSKGWLGQPDSVPCIQAALPCLLMAGDQGRSELTLRGGTDAAMAPPVYWYKHVCLPLLRAWWGLEADVQVCLGLLRDWLATGCHYGNVDALAETVATPNAVQDP